MCQTPSRSVVTSTLSLRPGIWTCESAHGAPSDDTAESTTSASRRTDHRDRRDRTECMMHLHAWGDERGNDSTLESGHSVVDFARGSIAFREPCATCRCRSYKVWVSTRATTASEPDGGVAQRSART